MKPLLIVIGGPTGIGKTATAIELAKELRTEIISADSRQLFSEMTIGTAVPCMEELQQVKHHFIQSHSVTTKYNASIFETEVLQLLETLFGKYKVAIMVGGSGLYIDAVCTGIDDLPSIPATVREKFSGIYEKEGLGKLHQLLKECDLEYYRKVDLYNSKRILKALEVYEITGRPYSSFLKYSGKERPFDCLKIFLDIDRRELYNRINMRVDKMVEAGLENEARALLRYRKLPPLNTVGYKEFFDYFDGKITRNEAITQIKNHSRAYARRQLTWFRRYTDACWSKPDDIHGIMQLITSFTNKQ